MKLNLSKSPAHSQITSPARACIWPAVSMAVFAAVVTLSPLSFLPAQDSGTRTLHTGWKITPAGKHQATADMLLGSALSPDGKTIAYVSSGFSAPRVYLVDSKTGEILQSLPVDRSFNGIAWSRDGSTLYASGGPSPKVNVFRRQGDGSIAADIPIALPGLSADPAKEPGKGQAYVAGLALSPDGRTLFAANIATDTIYALSLSDGRLQSKRQLTDGARPYCVKVSGDGSLLYVTQWALDSVFALRCDTLETARTFATGRHPNDLAFTRDGRLAVSCGNDDAVFMIDLASGQAKEQIRVSLTKRSPAGATPGALALSPDEKNLFVANADNNAVAVVDISRPGESRVSGFIPTGWYPTGVLTSPDGKRLFIASGKGLGTRPNPARRLPIDRVSPQPGIAFEFIGSMLGGLISMLEVPDSGGLAALTRQVVANTPYSDENIERPALAPRAGSNPIPSGVGNPSPIRYLLYIIKENRTYDQVLGDFKDHTGKARGNGDPNLTLFGEEVTPNQHELARQFVLLDNLYCSGEVSADGHPWSTGAYVVDITQRTWPSQYGGRGRQPLTEKVAVPPAGYIWDLCAARGISYRSYGEYVYATGPDAPPEALASSDGATSLKGHASAAWQAARAAGKRDYEKADAFVGELREFERNNTLPRFMIMSLGENHTQGTRPGAFTPKAAVASNDVALGKIVEACTQSRYWKEMAIFVIEDDAQNGPDHVDAHRTVGLAISPYTRRQHLDSTFYTTVSMLRTMELILGLPPMSQYDAAATPMYASFTSRPDFTPYASLPARSDLQAKNPSIGPGARASLELDFSDYDRITVEEEDILNRALWHSIKGEETPYPVPVRRALLARDGRPR